MRFAIIGAGALGSTFASRLAEAGHDVVLLARSAAHVGAIRETGLAVLAPDREWRQHDIDARIMADGCAPADVAIILTKSQDCQGAARHAGPLISIHTAVVALPNGIGCMDAIDGELGPGHSLVLGVTSVGARVVSPGQIEITRGTADKKAPTWIGPWNATCSLERVRDIARTLTAAGLSTEAMADIAPLVWTKLAMACAMNAIAGVTRLDVRCVLEAPAGTALICQVIEEVVLVGRAAGVDLDLAEVTAKAFEIYEGARNHVPSMAVDIREGRPTEVGALNEAVARLAETMEVAAPLNSCLAQLIRTGEQAAVRSVESFNPGLLPSSPPS